MLQKFSFGMSTILALSGIGCAAFGLVAEQYKPIALGLVLICGAAVFATLYRGTRKSSREPA